MMESQRDRYRDDPWYEGTESLDGEEARSSGRPHPAVAAIDADVARELAAETANEVMSFDL